MAIVVDKFDGTKATVDAASFIRVTDKGALEIGNYDGVVSPFAAISGTTSFVAIAAFAQGEWRSAIKS